MCKCSACFNKPICKISQELVDLATKYDNHIDITSGNCDYYKEKKEKNKKPLKPSCKDTLALLGFCDDKAKPSEIEEQTIEDGKLCPCCEKILAPNQFEDDVCAKCGKAICSNCAIVVNGQTFCDNCF